MWRWRAAAPTEPVRATASSVSSAGNRAALIMKLSLTFTPERFTGLHSGAGARYALASLTQEETHGTDAARQGVGGAFGPDAAVRPDPAADRPAPHPRGDDAAGLPDAEGRQAEGADARADLRHAGSHHPHDRSGAPLRRPD